MNFILTVVLVSSIITLFTVFGYRERMLKLQEQLANDRIAHKKELAKAWHYYNKNLIKLVDRIKKLEEK